MRVCMVSYSFMESDTRVMLYARALVARGDEVDAICLGDKSQGTSISGVHCYKVQDRVVNEKTKFLYFTRLLQFLVRSFIRLSLNHLRKRYDVVHVHSVPDFEVFAAVIAKVTGAKVILDMHDLVPELYASKFNGSEGRHLAVKTLLLTEKVSIKFADHVIIANHLWREKIVSRSVQAEKCTVIMNYPDRSIFYRRPRARKDATFVMMYPGTLNFHQGVDVAVRAFSRVHHLIPAAQLHIYGQGEEKERLIELILELNLREKVLMYDFLPTDQIVSRMADADLGIVPKRNDLFGGDAFSTKIFEFMALGIPVVVSGTRIDRFYFNEDVVKFFEPEDEEDLAKCMLLMTGDMALRERLVTNSLTFVTKYSWQRRKDEYLQLVDRLADRQEPGTDEIKIRTIKGAR